MTANTALSKAENSRSYRQRLRASGGVEVLFELPREMLSLIDDLKKRQGLRNRNQVLMQLIERGMNATQ